VARCLQGDVEAQQGALQRAAATYTGVLEAPTLAGALPPAAGMAAAGLAHVRYALDERREAEQLLALALEQGRLHGEIDTLLSALIGRTLLCQAQGNRAGAAEALEQLDELAHRSGHRQLRLLAKSMRVRDQLRWGSPTAQDRAWAQDYAPAAHPLTVPEVIAQLSAGRVCLSTAGDHTVHAAALERLKQLRALAAQAGYGAAHLEALLLEALGHAALGATGPAETAFARVLELAAAQGQIRLFADVEPALQRLLLPLLARARPQGAAAQHLLQQIRNVLGVASPPASPLAEPLSPREHEILGLIAEGLSNEAIAGKLVVTVATVKKHGTSLFGKLGVASRTEAVARARTLGILP
jgi:LuxR family maltose regulon positive regulatory protein